MRGPIIRDVKERGNIRDVKERGKYLTVLCFSILSGFNGGPIENEKGSSIWKSL